MLVSGVQQSDSVIHTYLSIFFRYFSLIGYYKIPSIVPMPYSRPFIPLCLEEQCVSNNWLHVTEKPVDRCWPCWLVDFFFFFSSHNKSIVGGCWLVFKAEESTGFVAFYSWFARWPSHDTPFLGDKKEEKEQRGESPYQRLSQESPISSRL